MKFVLVVIIFVEGGHGKVQNVTIEKFKDWDSCQAAVSAIGNHTNVKTNCKSM